MADAKRYRRGLIRTFEASIVERILALFFEYEEIPTRSDPDVLYMRRFFVARNLFLHFFYRSDEDPDPHCHPWSYRTTVLWNGYRDEAWRCWWDRHLVGRGDGQVDFDLAYFRFRDRAEVLRFGDTVGRDAEHVHRVRLLEEGKITVTLVTHGKKTREWYFHTKDGPVHNEQYLKEKS